MTQENAQKAAGLLKRIEDESKQLETAERLYTRIKDSGVSVCFQRQGHYYEFQNNLTEDIQPLLALQISLIHKRLETLNKTLESL